MFIRLTESDGRAVYINAMHVRLVRARAGVFGTQKSGSEVLVGSPPYSTPIKVEEHPDRIVSMLVAVLPPGWTGLSALDEDVQGPGGGGGPGMAGD